MPEWHLLLHRAEEWRNEESQCGCGYLGHKSLAKAHQTHPSTHSFSPNRWLAKICHKNSLGIIKAYSFLQGNKNDRFQRLCLFVCLFYRSVLMTKLSVILQCETCFGRQGRNAHWNSSMFSLSWCTTWGLEGCFWRGRAALSHMNTGPACRLCHLEWLFDHRCTMLWPSWVDMGMVLRRMVLSTSTGRKIPSLRTLQGCNCGLRREDLGTEGLEALFLLNLIRIYTDTELNKCMCFQAFSYRWERV